MAMARFKDLCLDANDPLLLGPFWAAVLDRSWDPDSSREGRVNGRTPQHGIWINRVPEAKTAKQRVHVDIYAESVAGLVDLGSTVVRPAGDDRRWTVLADPEGGEYCAFLQREVPADRMHGLVVDSVDPAAQARWWGSVLDAEVIDHPDGYSTVQAVVGMPILTMDFVPVPEPKKVKNRIHWDVDVLDIEPILDAGARVLRRRDEEIDWHVLADPEGNEFCAFVVPGG